MILSVVGVGFVLARRGRFGAGPRSLGRGHGRRGGAGHRGQIALSQWSPAPLPLADVLPTAENANQGIDEEKKDFFSTSFIHIPKLP